MHITGKKVNLKTSEKPVVSPAAHGAVISKERKEFLSFTVQSHSFDPTPSRGQLLGIIRPVWQKVMESECRLNWLHEMVRLELVVRNIESYAKSISDCLRTEEMIYREEEKKVLMGLMKIKLKDERKHLEIMQRVRERARKWLKEIVGESRKYSTIIKHIRI